MRLRWLVPAVLTLVVAVGCSDKQPTKPAPVSTERLLGGGRQSGSDTFHGGIGESGPRNPAPESSFAGYGPIFYSDIACGEAPKNVVITNQTDWQAWWTVAVSCLPKWDSTSPWIEPGQGPSDTTRQVLGWPNGPIGPYDPHAPAINFDTSSIVAITIEPEQTPGQFVRVTEVVSIPAGGTVVKYVVTSPGPDCMILMKPQGDSMWIYAPTTAVLVPRIVAQPVTWERSDVEMNCQWVPDPKTPITLYYTDAPCDLGASEVVITDEARFKQWIETAMACDVARWHQHGDSTTIVIGDSTSPGSGQGWIDTVGPGGPVPYPPSWNGFDVDFSKQAVIILRAGDLTQWGGGIWLDEVKASATGTTIAYSVMQPGDQCPAVGNGQIVNPTVAIRVPLPLTAPITWDRRVQTISCDWGHPDDSTRVRPDSSR